MFVHFPFIFSFLFFVHVNAFQAILSDCDCCGINRQLAEATVASVKLAQREQEERRRAAAQAEEAKVAAVAPHPYATKVSTAHSRIQTVDTQCTTINHSSALVCT